MRWLHDEDVALDRIIAAANAGAAVDWVRNTVGDCLRAAAALEARGIEPIVFHARFAQCDRQRREEEVIRRFGRDSTPAERHGVVIATQVIEQSLDLDFDVLISDVAPVDLLIQRLGRLWRHAERKPFRPEGITRELLVLAPPFDAHPLEDWISALLPGTAAVYGEVGLLWRTVRALTEGGAIETPGVPGDPCAVRTLVQRVYDDSDVPEALAKQDGIARGEGHAAASAARYGVRVVTDGYHGSAQGWLDDVRMPTRMGREQTTIRLARVRDDGILAPWAGDAAADWPVWKCWALSEVRVSGFKVPRDVRVAPTHGRAVEALREGWTTYEQELIVLPLVQRGADDWHGTLFKADGTPIEVEYSTARGFIAA
ncbi:MAG TPA: CRISPR-associated helicase Cas3' [Candidatus Elarobacter sp.]|nr:CRISPR-associated helicase Cas3' [Candidatus Elarobacter sp.]